MPAIKLTSLPSGTAHRNQCPFTLMLGQWKLYFLAFPYSDKAAAAEMVISGDTKMPASISFPVLPIFVNSN